MSPKVTQEYRQAVRDKIIDAAETLFSRNGYYDTSMDEIVRESGLSKGAIYGHFKSKEELFVALQDRQLEVQLDQLRSTFAPGHGQGQTREDSGYGFHIDHRDFEKGVSHQPGVRRGSPENQARAAQAGQPL